VPPIKSGNFEFINIHAIVTQGRKYPRLLSSHMFQFLQVFTSILKDRSTTFYCISCEAHDAPLPAPHHGRLANSHTIRSVAFVYMNCLCVCVCVSVCVCVCVLLSTKTKQMKSQRGSFLRGDKAHAAIGVVLIIKRRWSCICPANTGLSPRGQFSTLTFCWK